MTAPFDHHSEEFARNWRATCAELRARCPVAHTDRHGGYFVVTRYDDVLAVLRDSRSASSGRAMEAGRPSMDEGVTIPPNPFRMGIMEMDPPDCTMYRRVLNPWFSRGAVEAMAPRIRELVTWCIDRFVESGRCDLVDDLANPLPALVTLDLLGIPLERWRRYGRVMHEAVYRKRGSADEVRALLGDVRDVVAAGGDPGGLIDHLRHAEVGGQPLPEPLIVELVFMILNGGTDTTTALIAHLMLHLVTCGDDRQRLLAHPELIRGTVQELIRVSAPATGVARTVTAPMTLSGVTLQPGDRVLLALGSANADETRFPEANRVVIDREPNQHLAFGSGLHRCLGAELATVEMEILVEEVLRRLPDLTVDEPAVVSYPSIPLVNGFSAMPAAFIPGPRVRYSASFPRRKSSRWRAASPSMLSS